MDLICSPKLPALPASFHIDGMKVPAERGYVQNSVAEDRCRTNGFSDPNLPS